MTTDIAPPAEPDDAIGPLGHEEVPVMPEVAEGVATVYLDPAAAWAGEVGADPTGQAAHGRYRSHGQPDLRRHQGWDQPPEPFEAVVYPGGPPSSGLIRSGKSITIRGISGPSRTAGRCICSPGAQDRHQVVLDCRRHGSHAITWSGHGG